MNQQIKYPKVVFTWLVIGLIMVFVQVIIGGITRLTESGLSITKWEVVSGTLPPLNELEWQQEFDLYKATPQYKEINEGMSFEDFKFIYFWEYIHRFWARVMGFVFLFPFLYFYFKGYLDRPILKNLGRVVFLAILAATFGWIMVASGLVERPWVNAYKLSLHLMIAFSVFAALFWTYLEAKNFEQVGLVHKSHIGIKRALLLLVGVFILQLFLGGVMSGMKAAVIYPTWPDMHGIYLPSIIFDLEQWNADNFNNYDKNPFMPALIHFLHRNVAYILFLIGIVFSYRLLMLGKSINVNVLSSSAVSLLVMLLMQVLLGIITVLSSSGKIPVLWGVLHQAGALVLTSIIVFIIFVLRIKKIEK
jgi:cytochrome c oxidase assembly protein subunit 15